MTDKWRQWCVVGFALVLMLCLAFYHARQIITAPLAYDDAINASAGKNLALGYGYSSSYPDIINFDPNIATAPVIILPTALLMRLLGNKY